MKRGLVLTLIFCMCVSFSSYASMITSLKCYNDKETGIVYFFGKFSEDAKDLKDAGFKINNRYFSLNKKDENNPSKTGFQVALENDNRAFGIGIKNTDKISVSEFVATPYIENDKGIELMEESISFTKYNKNPQIVAAYSVQKLKPGYYKPNSSSFFDVTDKYENYALETSQDTSGNVYSYKEVLLKYDISDFYGITENNKAILKLNISSIKGSSCIDGNIKVLTVQDEDYSKDKAYYHSTDREMISKTTLTGTADKAGDSLFDVFTFDVTKIIIDKIAEKKNSVTFVIQLNNDIVREDAYVSLQEGYRPQLTIE